jgi:hypothetical protein
MTASAVLRAADLTKRVMERPRSASLFEALALDVNATLAQLTARVGGMSSASLSLAVEALDDEAEREWSSTLLRLLQTSAFIKSGRVNEPNDAGVTLLASAAAAGDLCSVNMLLAFGADASLQDNHGMTALDSLDAVCRRECDCWGIGCAHEPVRELLLGPPGPPGR